MFARIGAKLILLVAAMALVFFGLGLVLFGIAALLTPYVGRALGDVIAGGIFIAPPLLWALVVSLTRPRRSKMSPGAHQLAMALMAAVAKETPWIAVVGAGLSGLVNMFLNRNKKEEK